MQVLNFLELIFLNTCFLGMLIAGVALRNIPYINVAKDINPSWSSTLRSIALVVILLKAGLELDASVSYFQFRCTVHDC